MAKSTTPRSATPKTATSKDAASRKPRAVKPAAPKVVAAAPKLVVATRTPGASEIAMRAYELFLENGSQHGFDVEHWLQAEHELRTGRMTSAA